MSKLKAELREARRIAASNERDLRDMLRVRDAEIAEQKASIASLQTALRSAGKYFEYLRTNLSLIRQNAAQAENGAAHFAGAYAPEAQTPR